MDDLTALDFTPQCACGRESKVWMEWHPAHPCGGEPRKAAFMCGVCLKRELDKVQSGLLDVFLGLQPPECPDCRLTMVALSDIVVRLQPLWIWAE